MGWEWIPKKCGLNFATSGYGPDVIYAWETAPVSSITRGTNPLSEDNLSLPFEKYWNLDDKLIAYFSCDASGHFTVTLTDISTTPHVQLCYVNGVNLQTPCSIDLMMGIDQSQGSAFAVFLMTRAGVTSDFIVVSTLGALGGNRNRLCGILNQIPDDAPTPTYNWQSVPSISGKNGILSLSVIKDELLGDLTGGTWQSVSEVMDALTPNSRLYKYWNNLATGQEVTMCYSGDNYLNIKRDTASSCELKFYFRSGVLIYSTGVNMSTLGRDPYLAMVIDEENHVVQVIIVYELDVQGSKQITWYGLNPSDTEMSALYSWLVYGEPDTPNNPYAQGTTANGGDDFNLTPQDDFGDELPPDITGLDCGFFTVYCPTSGQLQSLASFLWSDDIIDNIKKYFGNVSDSIISLYMLPYKPSGLSTKKFQVGDIVLDDGPSVEFLSGQRYVDIDMGSFSIEPTFNSYLDYEPFTRLSIYLPFIGVQQLPTDEFMTKADPSGALSDKSGSTITVKYRIDLLTGGCVAYIKQGTQNKLQFSGKCGATLPISGANYNNMISGLVQAVGGLASTIASGGLTAPLSFGAAISGTVSAMKPDLYKAGNLSGELSLLSYNRPMIIKTRPNIHKDMSEQIDVDGLPSYKVKTIGDYNGYISCVAVHVDGINCTDAEKEKIHSLLLEGVIV